MYTGDEIDDDEHGEEHHHDDERDEEEVEDPSMGDLGDGVPHLARHHPRVLSYPRHTVVEVLQRDVDTGGDAHYLRIDVLHQHAQLRQRRRQLLYRPVHRHDGGGWVGGCVVVKWDGGVQG